MSVEDAIHQSVLHYPGGAPALAARMKLAPQTLRNMAQPGQVTHGWSLVRFRQLLAFAGPAPLFALCEENGGTFVPTSDLGGQSHAALLQSLAKLSAEFGDVPREVQRALSDDGRISLNDLRRIQTQLMELVQAASEVHARVREAHERRLVVPVGER